MPISTVRFDSLKLKLKLKFDVLSLGTIWVVRGDASTWAQNNPKFRPSAVRKRNEKRKDSFSQRFSYFQCVAKLSTYLTNATGTNDPTGLSTGQYCVQIAIERTVNI
jgi:hypothetical protein